MFVNIHTDTFPVSLSNAHKRAQTLSQGGGDYWNDGFNYMNENKAITVNYGHHYAGVVLEVFWGGG